MEPFLMSWVFVALLVLALAAILMPLYVIQIAGDARKARRALERIEALLEAQKRGETANAWQDGAAQAEAADRTIYPVKSPAKVSRLR